MQDQMGIQFADFQRMMCMITAVATFEAEHKGKMNHSVLYT